MNLKKTHFAILVLIGITALISSCSSVSNLAFTKRHYRSGYYVDVTGQNNSKFTPAPRAGTDTGDDYPATARVQSPDPSVKEDAQVPAKQSIQPMQEIS